MEKRGEEEQPIEGTNLMRGYQFASLLFSLIFVDNLLRWIEGRGDSNWFWLCSGKSEMLVLFGVLGLVAQVFYWSEIVAVVNERRSGAQKGTVSLAGCDRLGFRLNTTR